MSDFNTKIKHSRRRKDHIAKDLRTPKYRERAVDPKRLEDQEEKRFRRFQNFDDYLNNEPWHPLDQDNEDD